MTELTTTELAAQRARRFADVLAGYEAEGPDGSVPGASHDPARYAVITESSRGHGYFATYAATLADVETVAAANVGESWWPVCYFDLDVLAGEEPEADEPDERMPVRYLLAKITTVVAFNSRPEPAA